MVKLIIELFLKTEIIVSATVVLRKDWFIFPRISSFGIIGVWVILFVGFHLIFSKRIRSINFWVDSISLTIPLKLVLVSVIICLTRPFRPLQVWDYPHKFFEQSTR